MVKYFYKNLKSRKFKEISSYRTGSWVYAESPTPSEIDDLAAKFKLEKGHLEDALDMDEVPRFETEGSINYIYTRFAYRTEQQQITTAPLLIVIGKDFIVTVTPKPMPRLQRFINDELGAFTTQRTKLMLLIMNQIVDEYERLLTQISRQIKTTRARLRVEQINNRDFIEFVIIEDELNEFLTALVPTNTILHRLLTGKHLALFEKDEDLIEDLLLSNEQSIESCRSNIKTIISIREAYSTIATNNLNQVIKLLTSLTVILTVPTIVASIYGMNVRLPFEDNVNAFWIVVGWTAVVTVALTILFRRQKWF